MIRQLIVKTSHGESVVEVIGLKDRQQVNVYKTLGGVGLFAVFPLESDDISIIDAMTSVLDDSGLGPDQDITDRVKDSLVAGTVSIQKD